MSKLHSELRRIQKQRDRVKERLSKMVEKDGVAVSEEVNGNLVAIMMNQGSRATETAGCTYFQRIFWQQQTEAAGLKRHRFLKIHPI